MSRPVMNSGQTAIVVGDNKIIVHKVASNISTDYELVREPELDDEGRVVLRFRQQSNDAGLVTGPAMRPREIEYDIPKEDSGRMHVVIF